LIDSDFEKQNAKTFELVRNFHNTGENGKYIKQSKDTFENITYEKSCGYNRFDKIIWLHRYKCVYCNGFNL